MDKDKVANPTDARAKAPDINVNTPVGTNVNPQVNPQVNQQINATVNQPGRQTVKPDEFVYYENVDGSLSIGLKSRGRAYDSKHKGFTNKVSSKTLTLGVNQKYFEAPNGEIVIGDASKQQIWYPLDVKEGSTGGYWINEMNQNQFAQNPQPGQPGQTGLAHPAQSTQPAQTPKNI